jgi:hypothetical protein
MRILFVRAVASILVSVQNGMFRRQSCVLHNKDKFWDYQHLHLSHLPRHDPAHAVPDDCATVVRT